MNPITTTQLENTQPMTLPSSITAPVPDINSFITTTPQMQEQQTQVNRAKKQQTDTLGNIFTGLTALGERGATQMSLEEQAGIPTLSKELVDIENQLRQKDLEFRREREAIQVTPGLTRAQMQARLADVTRNQSSQLADLEVIRQARSNSLTNAQSLIDRKVELEFGDKKAKVDALKFIYDENKDLLSKEEDKLLSETIRREERAFNLAKSNFEQLENEKIQLVRNAQANGAGNNVMSAILNSKSLEEAYKNAGSFGMSIDDKIKQQQLSKISGELSSLSVNSPVNEKVTATQNLRNIVSDLATMSGKGGAVGMSFQKLIPKFIKGGEQFIAGTPAANFKSSFDLLKDSLAMENLGKLKGAMSDKDLEFLRNTGTRLSLSMSESEFNKELNALDERFRNILIQNGIQETELNPLQSMSNEDLFSFFNQQITNQQFFNRQNR